MQLFLAGALLAAAAVAPADALDVPNGRRLLKKGGRKFGGGGGGFGGFGGGDGGPRCNAGGGGGSCPSLDCFDDPSSYQLSPDGRSATLFNCLSKNGGAISFISADANCAGSCRKTENAGLGDQLTVIDLNDDCVGTVCIYAHDGQFKQSSPAPAPPASGCISSQNQRCKLCSKQAVVNFGDACKPAPTCPGDLVPAGSGDCVCPAGTQPTGGDTCGTPPPPPPPCPGDTVRNDSGDCVCPAGTQPTGGDSCGTPPPPPPPCPGDTVRNDSGDCVCPEGTEPTGDDTCGTPPPPPPTCPGAKMPDASGKCVCPDGFTEAKDDNCVKPAACCPDGTIFEHGKCFKTF